jgi:hypothetical protein
MKTRSIAFYTWIIVVGVAVVGCSKDYYADDAPIAPGGTDGVTTDTLSFIMGWQNLVQPVHQDGSEWVVNDSIGHLDIGPVSDGDKVYAVLQVGLQWPDASCMDDVHVSAGVFLCQDTSQTPFSENVFQFSGDMAEEPWPYGEWEKQFVRVEQLNILPDMSGDMVQGYVRVWTDCPEEVDTCFITNKSLTLVILRASE